ncbi:HlyD family secretion protein [Aerolutibacter ruishenii]|uniref:HlyD family secretion protein n=1 Tax=Aerolutibacter ruishenii TaxID=686800 RepID=A0A562LK04_9GAMM|nr:HlyD family efflux transporter periplasmic adaptor subunit [Lysobacter ruishenii]TWI07952.1 HlyD family secretion protein [Lysobacter ruishenii]
MTNGVDSVPPVRRRASRTRLAGGSLLVGLGAVAALHVLTVPTATATLPVGSRSASPTNSTATSVTKSATPKASAEAEAIVITGELQSLDAQPIYTPQANMSPVMLRYYVPEGTVVKRGDVVLRIDAGQSASQIRTLDAQIDQARARMAKELAELQVKVVDAELALVDADATLATARIDAALPKGLISGLDYDRYQGELERAMRETALKREELATARAVVARRQGDGSLEVRKLQVQRDYHDAQVGQAEVRADRDGVVLHGFNNNWIGGRIDEGSSTMPGSKAGEVVSGGAMRVRAWALEPDRRGLAIGQPVTLAFDALPDRQLAGRITAIAGAPDRKQEWGEGRYFQVDVAFQPGHGLKLLPGMSVRVAAGGAQ